MVAEDYLLLSLNVVEFFFIVGISAVVIEEVSSRFLLLLVLLRSFLVDTGNEHKGKLVARNKQEHPRGFSKEGLEIKT